MAMLNDNGISKCWHAASPSEFKITMIIENRLYLKIKISGFQESLVLLTLENCFVKPNIIRARDNKKTIMLEQETKKLALKFQT